MDNSPSKKRTIILGIGNTIRKDDGVGIVVVEALERSLGSHSNLVFETMQSGGVDILYSLNGFDFAIIVDGAFMNAKPGEVKWLPIERAGSKVRLYSSTHSVGILETLRMAETLQNLEMPEKILVLAIQVKLVDVFGEELTEEVSEGAKIAFQMIVEKLKEAEILDHGLAVTAPEF